MLLQTWCSHFARFRQVESRFSLLYYMALRTILPGNSMATVGASIVVADESPPQGGRVIAGHYHTADGSPSFVVHNTS